MIFHTAPFGFFFLTVFVITRFLGHRAQNLWLLAASYFFYAWWDWRFLFLLFFITASAYLTGTRIHQASNDSAKKRLLTIALILHLSLLGLFKYFNFFIGNLIHLLNLLGLRGNYHGLSILLPLGISFYLFKAMSYYLDIYRGIMKPENNFLNFALYVAFFPQLISGPIDRAADLLPQIDRPRPFVTEDFYQGCHLTFWGFFLKLFVADNLASLVDPIFNSAGPHPGPQILLAAYAYSIQLYGDFSGYSLMAWGIAKILGFQTTHNFNQPFCATHIQGFWNRWHISLSSWIRDYLYTPVFLASRFLRKPLWQIYFTTLVSMFFMGLWHGAGWHYIAFGLYHGTLLCLYAALRPWFQTLRLKNILAEKIWFAARLFFMFQLTSIGFFIFRARSCRQALGLLSQIPAHFSFNSQWLMGFGGLFFYIGLAALVEYFQYTRSDRFAVLKWPPALRAAFYVLAFSLLSLYGGGHDTDYIYFQF